MSTVISKSGEQFLYQQVIELIGAMQESGTLNPGDKLPSLRKLSAQLSVSIPTVKQAYIELERLGKVEARPKSGYFLRAASFEISSPKRPRFVRRPVPVRCQTLIEEAYEAVHAPNTIPLGVSHPVMASPPDKTLARIMRRVLANAGPKVMAYGPMDGYLPLKRQIAQRYLERGVEARHEDIIVTNGAQEALAIALQSVAKAGDIVAVESPTYFGILELIENLGMMALEIPTCADGICLDDLQESLDEHRVTCCVFSSLINNPTGSCMSDEKRQSIVEILEAKNIPLIEDDVYGELHFDDEDVLPMQAYSKKGLVITCSSFSKTAAPSYRVGWILSNRFEQKAKGLKRALSCSSSLLNQWVINEYLRSGDYDRNIKRLRQVLRTNKERMRALIAESFPEKTCISDPQGGGVVWVELPVGCDSTDLFHLSVESGISITPGVLFSASGKYKRCARISYGLPWDETVEDAVKRVGKLAHQLLND
ncbi:PLP-dependent aminotransferase family protein [Aliikangiella marina]|uniref:PLP-dependent aminotransferase family protein n=1 Tax=Aliikangiella marina TaxID=1712262 RepID=A0A545TH78_9GAMM|nr:PLP-dependent aminotransferase family protein [Aliikangiella marina]TQV76565.1 PLP-dependent aminotransferase family protein [Aliikangiella marina]